ncbi:hypothetical protein BaRGS_00017265, partial [Batillaria attramentaria]
MVQVLPVFCRLANAPTEPARQHSLGEEFVEEVKIWASLRNKIATLPSQVIIPITNIIKRKEKRNREETVKGYGGAESHFSTFPNRIRNYSGLVSSMDRPWTLVGVSGKKRETPKTHERLVTSSRHTYVYLHLEFICNDSTTASVQSCGLRTKIPSKVTIASK